MFKWSSFVILRTHLVETLHFRKIVLEMELILWLPSSSRFCTHHQANVAFFIVSIVRFYYSYCATIYQGKLNTGQEDLQHVFK